MINSLYPPDSDKVNTILTALDQLYPDADCELDFQNPFQLLIATILSAQCTDKKVNKVTSRLWSRLQSPADFVALGQDGLETEIRELGLFHNKAKNIIATCRELVTKYDGQVPQTIKELESLPGVGRKTANVVASNAFGVPALAVDTHVFRVSNRLGLAQSNNVNQVEEQLKAVIPQDHWIKAHHQLIWHGRRICAARRPQCALCPLQAVCNYYQSLS